MGRAHNLSVALCSQHFYLHHAHPWAGMHDNTLGAPMVHGTLPYSAALRIRAVNAQVLYGSWCSAYAQV